MSTLFRKLGLNWEVSLFSLLIISIFLPIRYIIPSQSNEILGYYSDFTSISLYLSLILVIFLIYTFWDTILISIKNSQFWLILLGILLTVSSLAGIILTPELTTLILYKDVLIICGLVVGLIAFKSEIWLKYKEFFLNLFILLGVIESILALMQFGIQQSLGLNMIGESPLSTSLLGVAKLIINGEVYLRAYGTLPHPNILGGFLLIISILNLYLLNKTTQVSRGILYFASWTIISTGLVLSFSRSALITLFLAMSLWILLNLIRKNLKTGKVIISILILISILLIFKPFLIARSTWNDSAVSQRQIFTQADLNILKDKFVFGTGPGTNLFHMEQQLESKVDTRRIQPVHNFFLILITDTGIFGIVLLAGYIYLFFRLIKRVFNLTQSNGEVGQWAITILTIQLSIFILFWVDHYFYTIFSATLLLAITTGLALQEGIAIPKQKENR